VVDLDDNYVPKGMPTEFGSAELPNGVDTFEDPRLFIHRGELYMSAFGFGLADRPRWHYLARLKRAPPAANVTTSADPARAAGFRLIQPRRLLLPEDVPPALALPLESSSLFNTRHPEKNWMPFIHNDSIHFIHSLNPLVVIRVVADEPDADSSSDIRTELVSVGGGVKVRWRYGEMRGGTPAVYDSALGGYVALFHSRLDFEADPKPLTGDPLRRYYYMGVCVVSPQPPFSIQLMSVIPMVGAGFYNDFETNTEPRQVVFATGLIVMPDGGPFIISYGAGDRTMWVAHFDRRKLLATLEPPLPESWQGPPC
jgi:hypothetical protein